MTKEKSYDDQINWVDNNLGVMYSCPEGREFMDIYQRIHNTVEEFPGTKKEYEDFRNIKCKIVDITKIYEEMSEESYRRSHRKVMAKEWIRNHLSDILIKNQIGGLIKLIGKDNIFGEACNVDKILRINRENLHSNVTNKIYELISEEYDQIIRGDCTEFESQYNTPAKQRRKFNNNYNTYPNLKDYRFDREKDNSKSIKSFSISMRKQFIDPKVIALIHYNTEANTGVPVTNYKK